MERQEIGGATLRPEVAAKVAEHYEHARRKHPYFANGLFLYDYSAEEAGKALAIRRDILAFEKYKDGVLAESLLECELAEAVYAFETGDKAHAVEEIYDTIAVLLRMVDVIEGRQALGNPESAKEEK